MIAAIRPVRMRRNAKEPPNTRRMRRLLEDARLYYAVANQHGSAGLGRTGSPATNTNVRRVTSGTTTTGKTTLIPSGIGS